MIIQILLVIGVIAVGLFLARPTGATSNKQGVNLNDQVAVRHLDPNVSLDPKCV